MSTGSACGGVLASVVTIMSVAIVVSVTTATASRPPAAPEDASGVGACARSYASANAARLASAPLPALRTASSHAARPMGSAPLPASAPNSEALIALACRRLIASMSNSTACFASARAASTMRSLSKRASPPLIFSRVVYTRCVDATTVVRAGALMPRSSIRAASSSSAQTSTSTCPGTGASPKTGGAALSSGHASSM